MRSIGILDTWTGFKNERLDCRRPWLSPLASKDDTLFAVPWTTKQRLFENLILLRIRHSQQKRWSWRKRICSNAKAKCGSASQMRRVMSLANWQKSLKRGVLSILSILWYFSKSPTKGKRRLAPKSKGADSAPYGSIRKSLKRDRKIARTKRKGDASSLIVTRRASLSHNSRTIPKSKGAESAPLDFG